MSDPVLGLCPGCSRFRPLRGHPSRDRQLCPECNPPSPVVLCTRCGRDRPIYARFHCRACWLEAKQPQRKPSPPRPHKDCVRCGKFRQVRAQGQPCWLDLHPELRERQRERDRFRSSHNESERRVILSRSMPPPLKPDQPGHVGSLPPLVTKGPNGIPLATLYDRQATDKERERRIPTYARMIEEHGRILWGRIPPPEDDANDAPFIDMSVDPEEED